MQKEKLKPEQVMAMLRKEELEITIEQATLILHFLRQLSKMAVSNYLATQQKVRGKHEPD